MNSLNTHAYTSSLKPTNKAIITKEGLARKQARLMMQALAKEYPEIYEQLEVRVNELIAFDQANPLSKVIGAHTGHQSARFKAVSMFKKEQLQDALSKNFHAVRLPKLTTNYTVPDLIGSTTKETK